MWGFFLAQNSLLLQYIITACFFYLLFIITKKSLKEIASFYE